MSNSQTDPLVDNAEVAQKHIEQLETATGLRMSQQQKQLHHAMFTVRVARMPNDICDVGENFSVAGGVDPAIYELVWQQTNSHK